MDDGLCAAGVVEERDAERHEGATKGVPEETSGRPTTREPRNPVVLDRIKTREEPEERELRHVPGGTWLNQVRSYIKDSFWLKGRGDEGRGEGRKATGRGEEEKGARRKKEGH
ncbi:hypothetical protein NDU88_002125 [Pleurodeles waltl]|uniref:Uncharacterized protein n=1 Tax=Pleurodeles waltl TaxID=8319 RepID=A0AAV7P5X3_PLEWA|nr:hypothetical protein NDU88_002125 [Pleurodeles waltl]